MLPAAQLSAHQMLLFLLQLGLLLLLATSLGAIAARCGMSAVVGELCAGVLAGPSVLAHALPSASAWLLPRSPGQSHLLDAAGAVGVILLVGVTGIRLDTGLARRNARLACLAGGGGFLVPLAAGVGIGFALPGTFLPGHGQRLAFALFLGVAMSVSALPVIARILADLRLTRLEVGQLILCAVTVDDIAGWLLLAIVPMAAIGALNMTTAIRPLAGLILLGAAGLAARPAVRRALASAGRAPGSGPTVALISSMLFLAAAASEAAGLEPVIGAFGCGILIASCGTCDKDKLVPMDVVVSSVLAPLYFTIAGLRMDLSALARPQVLATGALILVAAVTSKVAGGYCGSRLGGLSRRSSLAVGAGINARGVIEVIVATTGLQLGVLTGSMYTIIILVAMLTSVMTPGALRLTVARIPASGQHVPDTPEPAGKAGLLNQLKP